MSCFIGVVMLALCQAAPSAAARRVTCPDGRYFIVSGGDTIADTPEVPLVLVLTGRDVTVSGGCALTRGHAKPTKRGLRIGGRFVGCHGSSKRKLKAVIASGCQTLTGSVRGRASAPIALIGQLSQCGDGRLDPVLGEECDANVPCPSLLPCDMQCTCGGGGGTSTTTLPGASVSVTIEDAFCTTTACSCSTDPGLDYHLQSTGTASGPEGTELRVNVSALQGGQIDCGVWSPIDVTVNASCDVIKCCRRDAGQPATTNWAATEAIDLPCICPSASGLLHNYLAQAQLPPEPAVEAERTTSPCP